MNLVDLLDENGLQQDEWSLTAPTFGEDNQLTVVVGVKFGIAKISSVRVQKQDKQSPYQIEAYKAFKFKDYNSCRQAESECKRVLVRGVLSKQEMPDGYTETTYVHNLDKIIQIYKKYGGVEV